jgi:hypothetical protein
MGLKMDIQARVDTHGLTPVVLCGQLIAKNQSSSIGVQKIAYPGKMGLPGALESESNLGTFFATKWRFI